MVGTGNFMKQPSRRSRYFAWQLVLIAAPVLILAGMALYSLRQDRSAVEQGARDHAQTLVSTLGSQWQDSVRKDVEAFLNDYYMANYVPVALAWSETNKHFKLEEASAVRQLVEQTGTNPVLRTVPQIQCRIADARMVSPVEYPPLPEPPDWIHGLTPAQTDLSANFETALHVRRNPKTAGRFLKKMKAANIPNPVLANAEFGILMLETAQGTEANMPAKLIDFAHKYPESRSPSGTPLADLAVIRALESKSIGASEEALRQEVFRRIIQYPSLLTPEIIALSKTFGPELVQALEIIWQSQEEARAVLKHVRKIPPDPSAKISELWVRDNNRFTFVQRKTQDNNRTILVTLIPGRILESAFLNAWETTRNQIPSYISPEVEIAGRSWPVVPGGLESPELSQEVPVLASWAGKFKASLNRNAALDTGNERLNNFAPPGSFSTAFTLNLRLTQPDLLYASYQRRLWYTAALILAAAVAAWIGIINAWKGYRRQLKLAEMTSNFVSSVSHELRAPLASMRLMAESLDRGKIENEQKRKDYFRLIVQECRRLSSLVENVLDFSRIRQGRKRYEFEPIDGMALIRETVRMMETVANERNLTILFQTDADQEIQPEWDGPAVQQAVVNLLDNAIKHSPSGSVIKAGLEMTDEQKIKITIEDQGPGIRKEEQERIFDSFYRLGSELRRETRGIGIGLSIVKHVAEAHGGQVFLKSTPGQGSRFILELPLAPPTVRQT